MNDSKIKTQVGLRPPSVESAVMEMVRSSMLKIEERTSYETSGLENRIKKTVLGIGLGSFFWRINYEDF